MSGLQNFVNVSLATAAGGEDDYAHDQLSQLQTVGTGFRSLIYDLPQNADCVQLTRSCKPVWIALNDNPSLPELLVRNIFQYLKMLIVM